MINLIIKYWKHVGIPISLFLGVRNIFLFTTGACERLPEKDRKLYFFRQKYPKWGVFFIGSEKFLIGFVGSMAGWCSFYLLTKRIQNLLPNLAGLNSIDMVFILFSMLGLTGHLPETIYGLIESFSKLIEAVGTKLNK